jgi:hypothetical protein
MERVRIHEGDTPVLLIAPHGPDDKNTDYIVESVAREFGAFAVINKGWRKSKEVDFMGDLANCNDVRHLHCDVVKEEVLHPILRFTSRINSKYGEKALVLVVHGCSDTVREKVGDEYLDIIVGHGAGDPPSYSCKRRLKNAFVYHLVNEGFGVYQGKPGGKYSGKSRNNLNQLFTEWYPEYDANSLQLKIVRELRCEQEMLRLTIEGLTSAIDSLMLFDDTTNLDPGEINEI